MTSQTGDNVVHDAKADAPAKVLQPHEANLGVHIANRLVEVGCRAAFGVPGDFNLLLLDQLLKQPELEMVWCCNELNAGYAADGYARAKGIGCCVVTFAVGGFSALNAIAGAYSEDLPVILISGGPNSNDFASNRVLHHTPGRPGEYGEQMRAFREVTCCQVVIRHIEDAHRLVDLAISQAILQRKPAYIEVACNLADLSHPSFMQQAVPFALSPKITNKRSLEAAVETAVQAMDSATKVVLVGGVRLRHGKARQAFERLAGRGELAVAITPDAKGMVREGLKHYMGMYWGPASSQCVCEIVESSDLVISVGAVWTDYSTTGYSLLLKAEKMIVVDDERVTVKNGSTFGCIVMEDFLNALAERVQPKPAAFEIYQRMFTPVSAPAFQPENELLKTLVLFKHVQEFLTPEHALVAEVGDSWFNTQKLKLPDGAGYELQMRYGSIGWSVGAVLGQAKAHGPDKRVLAFIGDGSFQMTAQEVSSMLRYGLNPIILLINNRGYTIEVEIHDGPYNNIKNWNYTGLIEAFHNGEGELWTAKARTEPQLVAALEEAKSRPHQLCFIEVEVHRDDCSKELLEWGSRVAAANSRGPKPQQ